MTVVGAAAGARCVNAKACRTVGTPLTTNRQLGLGISLYTKLIIWANLPDVSIAQQRKIMSAEPAQVTQALPSASALTSQQDFLVQYVVIRKDLWGSLGWPLGSVVAQACHASSAAMWMYRDEEATQQYLAPENIDHMRKVVLEVKDEAQLRKLSEQLAQGGIGHKLWVEQPEDFPTCLATRPYAKSQVASYFKKFQLSKAPIG
ncbi:hypothetical protein Vafri_21340 [Volvox africanus]|uniref:peptidyl-tRNA hydrolase n=1 Tax=Volvox africanus TaxID=51714 RepID=A0A8J4BTA2_9CHLO|nr:hypothetical protein Vafri_21340 [Volvox africanus]